MLSKRTTLYLILILTIIVSSILIGALQINQGKSSGKDLLLMQGKNIQVAQLKILKSMVIF